MAPLPAAFALAAALVAGGVPAGPMIDRAPPGPAGSGAAAASPEPPSPSAAPVAEGTEVEAPAAGAEALAAPAPAPSALEPQAASAQPAPAASPAPAESAPPAAPERLTAAELIRRSMAAYGGSRARVRLGRVRMVGAVSSSLHPGEVGRFARTFARGRGLRTEVGFSRSDPEVRILSGAQAFRYGERAPAPVLAALQLEAARLELPALLLDREAQLQDQGELRHEGQMLRVLGLQLAPGARIECGLEPKTGRILYVRGLVHSGPRQLELFTVYRSFRVVDGVLVPFREEGYANGEPTGDVEIGAVEFLDEVPDAVFQP